MACHRFIARFYLTGFLSLASLVLGSLTAGAQDARITLIYPYWMEQSIDTLKIFRTFGDNAENDTQTDFEIWTMPYRGCVDMFHRIREAHEVRVATVALVSFCHNAGSSAGFLNEMMARGLRFAAVGPPDMLTQDMITDDVRFLQVPELAFDAFDSNAYSQLDVAAKPPFMASFCDNLPDIREPRALYLCTERGAEATELADAFESRAERPISYNEALILEALSDAADLAVGNGPHERQFGGILTTDTLESFDGNVRVLKGLTILNADYSGFNTYRSSSSGIDLTEIFSEFCPGCSGTGKVCGSSCPRSCNGDCVDNGSKKCCRNGNNGMPVPMSPWE